MFRCLTPLHTCKCINQKSRLCTLTTDRGHVGQSQNCTCVNSNRSDSRPKLSLRTVVCDYLFLLLSPETPDLIFPTSWANLRARGKLEEAVRLSGPRVNETNSHFDYYLDYCPGTVTSPPTFINSPPSPNQIGHRKTNLGHMSSRDLNTSRRR